MEDYAPKSGAETSVRQFESIYQVHRSAYVAEPVEHDRFGRLGRALTLFAYAGAGWALAALALFALADIL